MFDVLDTLHDYNRYLIFAALLLVLYRSFSGWLGKKPFVKTDNTASLVLTSLSDLQLLLGLALYIFLSPITQSAFADMGAAMKDPTLRYFAVEHISVMLIAVVLIHLGRSFSKKAATDDKKHRILAIYTAIAFVLILGILASKGLIFGTSDAIQ